MIDVELISREELLRPAESGEVTVTVRAAVAAARPEAIICQARPGPPSLPPQPRGGGLFLKSRAVMAGTGKGPAR